MPKFVIALLIVLISVPSFAAVDLKTDDQKTLYALGMIVARSIDGFNLSPEELRFVQQGILDKLNGKKPAVNPEDYQMKINQLAQAKIKAAADKQRPKSKAFLEKAAREKGAKKQPSGLIYTQIKAGTGAQPKPTDTVVVTYTGKLIDGKVFDSSAKHGKPMIFPLNRVIPCWTEGIGLMKVGGKARLVCPSEAAYGDLGRPPVIPGGAALIFEVELLEIKK